MGQFMGVDSRTVIIVVFCVSFVGMHTLRFKIQHPCRDCSCDCSSVDALFEILPKDCGKAGPEADLASLAAEELSLLKAVANETLQRTETLVSLAGAASSHYRSEAEKCSAAVETCEAARERAESLLAQERKLSALWEQRSNLL